MPIRSRAPLPCLIPLLLACTALFALTAYLLGGSPTARGKRPPDAEAAGTVEGPSNAPPPIACVVIDAGHGGEDGGASSAAGVLEKDLNLSVSLALRDLFEAAGIPVVMTRTEDILLYDRNVNFQGRKKALDLAARRLVAEKTAAEVAENGGGTCLFISIHMNAFPQPQYDGMQVWYGTGHPLSAEVAGSIQAASVAIMPENHRKIKEAGSNIYLLDRIRTPAVLVECGFLSNPAEAEKLSREDYRHALAALIFGAVAEHTDYDAPTVP
ncbi:MAG: N-acetylmuramoyl-L-alanine amidase [Clostridia bacterium]|nr:N-acetylmuramoyl-L-alanine amidase [Clostridia bacterium]